MNTALRITAASILTGLLAPFLLLTPAHADEPAPDDPCRTYVLQIASLEAEVLHWREAHARAIDEGSADAMAAASRALLAEDRAADLTADVAARTTERDRALLRVSRQARAIVRLQDKVTELRARLRNEPVE